MQCRTNLYDFVRAWVWGEETDESKLISRFWTWMTGRTVVLSNVTQQGWQGRAEKQWVREKREIREVTTLLANILCVHNHTMSHHLHCTQKKKRKCAFLWKCCIHDLSPTHIWYISHPFLKLTKFSMHSFSLSISFWVGLVLGFVCLCVSVCQPLCVLQQQQRSPGLSFNFLSQWVEASFWYLNRQGRLEQCFSPAAPTSLIQYLKMPLL